MIEQLIFIIVSIILFGIIFLKMIKKNDTSYVAILGIEALGIGIDFIASIFTIKLGFIIKAITYLMSIVLPIVVILLEKNNINIMQWFKFFQVDIYMSLNNNKKAKEILLGILDKDNENYLAHKKIAEIYESEGGLRKSIDEYVQCIDINKQDYDSYYKVATLLKEFDKKEEAIEMLTNLLDKKPDYTQATIDLGDLFIEKEMYKEAVSIYLEALKYSSVNYELYYNLGIVYTMINDFKSAKECYEKAAEINALSFNAKYSLAEIAMLYKNLDEAEKYFIEVSENEELEADCYFELAKINLMKGDKETAIKYANMAIDMDAKKISQKIKKEPLFMTIMSKISIPFNMEEKEDMPSLSKKEKLAKKHLEETTEITANMGYGKPIRREEKEKEEIGRQKE
ncbi:MAG: tetratricopeptide repeat protein [Clostridia bacterium]|nr:tetratricopeptide repeat protein [Clostridia bacterium]